MKLSLAVAFIWCFRSSYSEFADNVKAHDGERELLASYDEDGYKIDDGKEAFLFLEEIENDLAVLDVLNRGKSVPKIKGYKGYSTGGCKYRNELGKYNANSAENCAKECNAEPDCVSFEYRKSGTKCLLSSTCNSFHMTNKKVGADFFWYLKANERTEIEGYTSYSTGGCKKQNELGAYHVKSVEKCAKKCNAKSNCVSFKYIKSGTRCQLLSSCSRFSMTNKKADADFFWYFSSTSAPSSSPTASPSSSPTASPSSSPTASPSSSPTASPSSSPTASPSSSPTASPSSSPTAVYGVEETTLPPWQLLPPLEWYKPPPGTETVVGA